MILPDQGGGTGTADDRELRGGATTSDQGIYIEPQTT
jgi:hypothetical protein